MQFLKCVIRVLVALTIVVSWPSNAHAAEPDDRNVEARALFELGVEKTVVGAWQEAADLFERSRLLLERPATVLNLVLVYDKLGQPLRTVQMVQRLLQITDPTRHEDERQQALAIEARAYAQLSRLVLAIEPTDATIVVDGAEPVFARPQLLLLSPGEHELKILAPGYVTADRRVDSAPGEESVLTLNLMPADQRAEPLSLNRSDLSARPTDIAVDSRRTRASIALASLGICLWLSAVAVEVVAIQKSVSLAESEPSTPGYLSSAERLERIKYSVAPLAWTGAATSAAGLAWLSQSRTRRAGRLATLAAMGTSGFAVGLGAALWIPEPGRLGDGAVREPAREAGMILVAAALTGMAWVMGELAK